MYVSLCSTISLCSDETVWTLVVTQWTFIMNLPFEEDSAQFFRVYCFEPKCWVLSNAQYTFN